MEGTNENPATAATAPEVVSIANQATLTSEKARLECEKLKAEIDDIRKPVWHKTAFYSGVAPIALAVIGLVFTWGTGWFDVQRTRVSNDKTLLEAQTERLRADRSVLEAQARDQKVAFARAEQEIEILRQRESQLTNQVAQLHREREELRLVKEVLESETKRLAGSDEKALKVLEQLKTIQTAREQLSIRSQILETSNATLRATTVRQVALIRWANAVLSVGWRIALNDKATWAKFGDFGKHVLSVRVASANYLPEWQLDSVFQTALDERPVRTYDDDSRTEQQMVLRQAASKTYDDYLRDAQDRYELFIRGIANNHSNQIQGASPPLQSVPSR